MQPEFTPWPKLSRLNREIVITEKIDGTNAAIGIGPDYVYAQSRTRIITPGKNTDNMGFALWVEQNKDVLRAALGEGLHFGEWMGVGIQRGYDLSERRFYLFNTAKWHDDPAGAAALTKAREQGVALYAVPVLYRGPWTNVLGYYDPSVTTETGGPAWLTPDQMQDWPEVQDQPNPRARFAPNFELEWLKRVGSRAVPGYMNPEGICVFHKASGVIFKATCENDGKHKGEQ